MNSPAAGWNPDPTGRHEYRYWDGSTWTDDVSDGGVTSVDPVDGGALGGDPTTVVDPTQQYQPQPQPQPGFGPQPGPQSGYGQPGFGAPQQPYSTSGQFPPSQPVKSGPSTGLLVGLAALAVALIAGLAFVLTSGGDDDEDTATDDTTEDTSTDTTDDTTEDTSTDTTEDTSTDTTLPDDVSSDGLVELLAEGLKAESDLMTDEQATCAAQAMLDEIGLETLMEIGASGGDPFTDGSLTTEQQAAVVTAMTDCLPADVLLDLSDGG